MVTHISVGHADVATGLRAGPQVQYRIGSITKTITSMATMQLVSAGELDLRSPLSQAWPGAPLEDVAISDLLTHGSGLQREPEGAVWETLQFPEREDLAAAAVAARRLYPQGTWFHYSNLGFALLGEMLAQRSGTSWESWVKQQVLDPLGMFRTTPSSEPPAAQGYSVEPYSDAVTSEPPVDFRGIAPAGQLWSTAEDLCLWSGAIAGSRPELLAPRMLEEMRGPRTIADTQHWTWGFGLGLMLLRDGDVVYVGHTGSTPGFLAAVVSDPVTQIGVTVLTNSTAGVKIAPLAVRLLGLVRDGATGQREWSPGKAPPEKIAQLLGRWWSEESEWVLRWRGGQLQANRADDPDDDAPTLFVEVAPDEFLAVTGPERGERLVVVRGEGADAGSVQKFYWATYAFTRTAQPFASTDR